MWIETLQSSLCELRLPRHVGILWKELKWQITQFSSFLANKFVWMTCNSLCLWMRAFNLNISVLIRKRRLGDNDICWLWKEKTSNQHILTRQRLCFLAVHYFHFALKLWTCNVKKGAQKMLPSRTGTLWQRVTAGFCCDPEPGGSQEGVSERSKVLTINSMAEVLGHPCKTFPRDTSGVLIFCIKKQQS